MHLKAVAWWHRFSCWEQMKFSTPFQKTSFILNFALTKSTYSRFSEIAGTLILLLIPMKSCGIFIKTFPYIPQKMTQDSLTGNKALQPMMQWDNSTPFPKCNAARGVWGHAPRKKTTTIETGLSDFY